MSWILGTLNTNGWHQRARPRLLRLSVCLEMSTCVQYDSLLASHVLLHTRQALIFAHYGQVTISAWGAEPPRSGQKKVSRKKKNNTAALQAAVCLPCSKTVKSPPTSGVFFSLDFGKCLMQKDSFEGGVSISHCLSRRLWLCDGLKIRFSLFLSLLFSPSAAVLRAFNRPLQLIVSR